MKTTVKRTRFIYSSPVNGIGPCRARPIPRERRAKKPGFAVDRGNRILLRGTGVPLSLWERAARQPAKREPARAKPQGKADAPGAGHKIGQILRPPPYALPEG